MISLIVAHDKNRLIGNAGKIPWHIPSEMEHFKETTMGGIVIMGRKTYESIPEKFRPLSGRLNVVVSKSGFTAPGVKVFDNLEAAIDFALNVSFMGCGIFIIGGASIYKEALDKGLVDRLIISQIDGEYEGDAYFPDINYDAWYCTSKETRDGYTVSEYDYIGSHEFLDEYLYFKNNPMPPFDVASMDLGFAIFDSKRVTREI